MFLREWDGIRNHSAEDLSRKFANTYVKARIDGGDPMVVFITGVATGTGGNHVVSYVCKDATNRQRNRECLSSLFDIVCAQPKSGIYSLKDNEGIALVRRIPARQWHDGMYTGNTSILINGVKSIGKSIPFDIAEAVFADQQDIPLESALKLIRSGKSIRLNRNYWLTSSASKQVGLMRQQTRLGSWTGGQWYSTPGGKLFKEELKDELKFHANI